MREDKPERRVVKLDGVTFVIENKRIISRRLSKPVYLALKESGKYGVFMSCRELKDAKFVLRS